MRMSADLRTPLQCPVPILRSRPRVGRCQCRTLARSACGRHSGTGPKHTGSQISAGVEGRIRIERPLKTNTERFLRYAANAEVIGVLLSVEVLLAIQRRELRRAEAQIRHCKSAGGAPQQTGD